MKWLILLAVVVVLFALAWWSSGKAGPMRGRRSMTGTEKDALQGYNQRHTHNSGGGGFGL